MMCVMVQYIGNRTKNEKTMDQPASHPPPSNPKPNTHACVQPTGGRRSRGGQGQE